MILTRRQFVTTSSLVIVGSVRGLPLFGQQPPPVTRFEDLRGGVGIFTGQGGTIGWYVSPDALVVIDAQFPATAQACLDGLKQKSSRTIDALINTHHHGDHTAGNKVLGPAAKKIVAHANVPGLQKKAAEAAKTEADQVYANTTFTDAWKMDAGREVVRAKHYGPGHTGGDIVIHFEKADVVHMGDLMFSHRHPFVDRPAGASIANWMRTLEKVAAEYSAKATYIFGHAKDGLPVTGATADLLKFRDYFTAVLDHVRKGIQGGKSREEIVKVAGLPGFEDYMAAPPRLTLEGVLGVAHEELTASH